MSSTPVNVSLPMVVRIPIAGPKPYNTLVCCNMVGAFGLAGAGAGYVTRGEVECNSLFTLQGFDQRVAPDFKHSTSAWVAQVGLGEDDTWLYAIDSITGAGFGSGGQYYVTLDAALMFPHVPDDFKPAVGYEWWICVCSYVLVYEPPVSNTVGGMAQLSKEHQLSKAGVPSIVFESGGSAKTTISQISIPQKVGILITSNVSPTSQVRCRCNCNACRKEKCQSSETCCGCHFQRSQPISECLASARRAFKKDK